MLSISHTLTGALIATKIPNPYLAIPIILITHYLLDAVPHWDAGTGLTNGSKSPTQVFRDEIPDLIISGLLVILFFQLGKPLDLSITGLSPYWGAFVGLIPDFLEAPRNFLQKEPRLLKPLNRFHHSIHHSIPRKLDGLAPQIILITLIILLK